MMSLQELPALLSHDESINVTFYMAAVASVDVELVKSLSCTMDAADDQYRRRPCHVQTTRRWPFRT